MTSNYFRPLSGIDCNVTYQIDRHFANLIHLKNLIRENSIEFLQQHCFKMN